jgi:hypothetical protein
MTTANITEQLNAKKAALEASRAKNASPETIKTLEADIKQLESMVSGNQDKPKRRHSAFLDECSG